MVEIIELHKHCRKVARHVLPKLDPWRYRQAPKMFQICPMLLGGCSKVAPGAELRPNSANAGRCWATLRPMPSWAKSWPKSTAIGRVWQTTRQYRKQEPRWVLCLPSVTNCGHSAKTCRPGLGELCQRLAKLAEDCPKTGPQIDQNWKNSGRNSAPGTTSEHVLGTRWTTSELDRMAECNLPYCTDTWGGLETCKDFGSDFAFAWKVRPMS